MQRSRRKGTCSNDQRRTQKPVGVTRVSSTLTFGTTYFRHENSPVDFGLRGFLFADVLKLCSKGFGIRSVAVA